MFGFSKNTYQEKQYRGCGQTGWGCLGAVMMILLMGWGVSTAYAQSPLGWAEGRILVQPRAGLSAEEFNRILQRSKGKSQATIGKLNVHIVEVPPQAEQAVARALSRNPHVKFAEVDGLLKPDFEPNDPSYPQQWHLPKIQAPAAWDLTQGEGVTVAVLDTGIDVNHSDFQGQLLQGRNVVSKNSDISDIHGHGTAVAGSVGAITNNATAVSGVAGKIKILPVRVTNRSDGWTYYSDLAAGVTWAADQGAHIVSASYIANESNTVINAANYLRSKGGIMVNSAGNYGTDPGFADTTALITVSATDSNDGKADFSNYGKFVDVAAPGVTIGTTASGGGVQFWSGTSFSAPVAAGVVALIRAKNPELSISEVETILKKSADDLGNTLYYGAGRVNAANAVHMAGNLSMENDTQYPTVSIVNPVRDATVKGWVGVDVEAMDNVGVTKVVLYAGGLKVGEDLVAPYQFSWNSANENDGAINLIAYAYDEANNEGSSGAHPVIVDNKPDTEDTVSPTVSISEPFDGSTVSGTVKVVVQASDDVSLSSLKLFIDGSLMASSNLSPLSFSWNTRKIGSGTHAIKAVAVDGAGNTAETQIQVTIGSGSTQSPGSGNKGGQKKN